jgi:hypothetical protein
MFINNEQPRNYIADNSKMPVPPAYFLQRIYDFDAMLVLLPSRVRAGAYVIARKKQFGPGLTEKAIDEVYPNPDTKMCVLNGCVPVCMMFATGLTWDPEVIIRTLAARDIWAHGGPDKVADMLEEQESADAAATREAIRADLYNRSGDAWRSYQSRTGQSSHRFNDYLSPKQPASTGEVVAPPTTTGARSTAGSGSESNPLG